MSLSIFNAQASSKETQFWLWFVTNQDRIFAFESDQQAVFDDISEALEKVDENLTFEFGPVVDDKRDFIISAGGIKASFPSVESLANTAPALPKWTVIKYRPRRAPPFGEITYGDTQVDSDDVRYLLANDGDKPGIVLFFKDYSEANNATYGQIGFLFLDEALGEYAMETQVGFVEFKSRASKYFDQSMPLNELPAHFDEYLAARSAKH